MGLLHPNLSLTAALSLLSATTTNAFMTTNNRNSIPLLSQQTSTTTLNSINAENKKELPDYGKTTIEVSKIKLPKVSKKWIRQDLFGNSLVEETLESLENDEGFQATSKKLKEKGAAAMTKEERLQRRRALQDLGVPDFLSFVSSEQNKENGDEIKVLHRKEPKVLQVNIGLYCNQACGHCHVESSPLRTEEQMTSETVTQILNVLKNTPSITTLDITGGAPELNENFRMLVSIARDLRPDLDIIDRCNLTVLQEPGQEDLVEFLASNKVRVVASLPCYSADNVDKQRGNGVFDRSISALLALNQAGYGIQSISEDKDSSYSDELKIDLVYNPLGAFLPPEQKSLEGKYKEELMDNFGIQFNELFTMTNMPIKRFADFLYRRGELKEYMDLLVRNFNLDTTQSLMCLDTVNIGWDGKLYDCDFNQQLGFAIGANNENDESHEGGKSIFDIDSFMDLQNDGIKNDNHCFGCTGKQLSQRYT